MICPRRNCTPTYMVPIISDDQNDEDITLVPGMANIENIINQAIINS